MKKRRLLCLLSLIPAVGVLGSCNDSTTTSSYTLHDSLAGSPTNWSQTAWEMNTDTYVQGYCENGFVEPILDKENGGYKWSYEMAESIEDATKSDSTFNSKWGVTADEGAVWQINLNKSAKWQDGTAINADTYIESMKEMLDPEMQNYRANSFYSGDFAIVGANNYIMQGQEKTVSLVEYDSLKGSLKNDVEKVEDVVYLDWSSADIFATEFGSTYETVAKSYSSYFTTSAGVNLLEKYKDTVVLTDAIIEEFKDTPMASWYPDDYLAGILPEGTTAEEAWKYSLGSYKVKFPEYSFDKVGLIKTGDYTLKYVCANPTDAFNFNIAMGTTWLVKKDLFDAGKSKTGDLVASNYGTSADTYMAYGPYKLVTFEKDKQMKFERNENWYGWTDGKHEGQYQTTNIVCDIIPQHATALLQFSKGGLDSVDLEKDDLTKYGYSDYLMHTPETYTMRLVFDSNVDDLKNLESGAGDGKNKQILSEYDFRKAISLCVDRQKFNAEGTAGNEASYALLNSLYYYDVANDPSSIYRNTDEAKKVVVKLYGIEYGEGKTYKTLDEAYKAVTGYDLDQAKKLFQSAYDSAVKAGTYTKGQDIQFNVGQYDATTSEAVAQIKLLNAFIAAATVGTDLEGKITLVGKSYNGSITRYDAITGGVVEMAFCAWGGADYYPFNSMGPYTDSEQYKVNEIRSWDPTSTKLTVTGDFDGDGVETTETDTYYNWYTYIKAGGKYSSNMDARVHILASMEYGMLDMYNYAILGSYAAVSLRSKKINYGTYDYNSLYGYGGIRFTTYNYDDAGWDAYVAAQGGTVDYE